MFLTREYRLTAENAERALGERIRTATQVLEQTPLLDEKGKQVGRRIVALFDSPEVPKQTPSILWTNGDMFYVIDSSSFKHSLLLEKEFFDNRVRSKNPLQEKRSLLQEMFSHL